jgi:hypothetical protein
MDETNYESKSIDPPFECETVDPALLKLTFAQHILDKRFHLELWLDGRVNSSLTLNAILGSMSVFLLDHLASSAPIARPIVMLGILFFTADLLLCSYLKIPRFIARKQHGQEVHYLAGNVRTTIDIEAYTAENYRKKFETLTAEEMILYTADQIKHVNSLIVQERRFINFSAYLTMSGIGSMAIAVLLLLVSSDAANILHDFGFSILGRSR